MPSPNQRQCPSQFQQMHGTLSLHNHPFLSASQSVVCCSLCCCVKALASSIPSEWSHKLVSVLTDAVVPSIRLYTWRVSLFLLLSTIIILIPASFCMVLTYRSGPSPSPYAQFVVHVNLSDSLETPSLFNIKAVAFLLPVALFIFTLSFVPLPAEFTSYNPLTSTAARLVVLGTIILGLLSGLGAVNAAWGTVTRKA